jgi:hypothetical protein
MNAIEAGGQSLGSDGTVTTHTGEHAVPVVEVWVDVPGPQVAPAVVILDAVLQLGHRDGRPFLPRLWYLIVTAHHRVYQVCEPRHQCLDAAAAHLVRLRLVVAAILLLTALAKEAAQKKKNEPYFRQSP